MTTSDNGSTPRSMPPPLRSASERSMSSNTPASPFGLSYDRRPPPVDDLFAGLDSPIEGGVLQQAAGLSEADQHTDDADAEDDDKEDEEGYDDDDAYEGGQSGSPLARHARLVERPIAHGADDDDDEDEEEEDDDDDAAAAGGAAGGERAALLRQRRPHRMYSSSEEEESAPREPASEYFRLSQETADRELMQGFKSFVACTLLSGVLPLLGVQRTIVMVTGLVGVILCLLATIYIPSVAKAIQPKQTAAGVQSYVGMIVLVCGGIGVMVGGMFGSVLRVYFGMKSL